MRRLSRRIKEKSNKQLSYGVAAFFLAALCYLSVYHESFVLVQYRAQSSISSLLAVTKDTQRAKHEVTFSFLWNGHENNSTTLSTAPGKEPTIDILSVGSNTRKDFLMAQRSTWASHPSVRYFFGVTESDDADPYCHENLTRDIMTNISNHCRRTRGRREMWRHSALMSYQANAFAHGDYLASKSPGWMCSQKRPSHGIGKVTRFYRSQNHVQLPDYLLIVDDDTFINLDWFLQHYNGINTSIPRADAGCLVLNPVHMSNFTFPFGGFGLFFSKGTVANLVRPIHCQPHNGTDQDDFSAQACQQLQQNLFGEHESFQEGMAIGDLMDAHASRERYVDFQNWTSPQSYCTHSDWATGFYTNVYRLSEHFSKFSNDPWLSDRWMFRIGREIGSIYRNHEGACTKDGFSYCNPETDGICHRLNATEMELAHASARRTWE